MSKASDALVKEAMEQFKASESAEAQNRKSYADDIRFVWNDEQWPANIKKIREEEERPCLTINRMKTFVRQVVNDARQNKPAIHAMPVDSMSDVQTANVISGMIRSIEYESRAHVAYSTAMQCAVSGGFGYFDISIDRSYFDPMENVIRINRIANPLSVYADPSSVEMDSSDWNFAFVTQLLSKEEWDQKYKNEAKVNWDDNSWKSSPVGWKNKDTCIVASYWRRDFNTIKVQRFIDQRTQAPTIVRAEDVARNQDIMGFLNTGMWQFHSEADVEAPVITHYVMSGAEILDKKPFPGQYIPIVPVYGEEYWIDGERYLRSLINSGKDAQINFNFWRSAAAELVALAPKTPWIGKKGTFSSDAGRWEEANRRSWAYLEYDTEAPQRQPMDTGPAAGALQEALNASDDIKSTVGMFDASLGARSNETSGVAIRARQMEGDVATFHFIDNMNTAIEHAGRIIIGLIPHVYSEPQRVRIVSEDGTEGMHIVNQAFQGEDEDGQPVDQLYDLKVGSYDVRVKAGPSYTTRREQAAEQMTELARNMPDVGPLMIDVMAKNFDWPGADVLAERFAKWAAEQRGDGVPPELMQELDAANARIAELEDELAKQQGDKSIEQAKVQVDQYEAQTDRLKMGADLLMQIPPVPPMFGQQ